MRQLLLHAFHWFDDALEASLAARGVEGLTPARALLLSQLGRGSSASELARRLGVSRQAAHKTVDDLERRGLLRSEPDPDNRSAQRVHATASGERTLAEVHAALAELETELARRLGRVRVRTLRATLEASWGDPAA